MSRRKLTPCDVAALNRGAPVGVRFPPQGGSAEPRMQRQSRRQRKQANEGGT